MTREEIDGSSPHGDELGRARWRAQLTPTEAAGLLGIWTSRLEAYESGLETPPPDVIAAMARVYDVDTAFFGSRLVVPEVEAPVVDTSEPADSTSSTSVFPPLGTASNRHMLQSIAAAMRSMRSLRDDEAIHLNEKERLLLGSVLDFDDSALPELVRQTFVLTEAASDLLIEDMMRGAYDRTGHQMIMAKPMEPQSPDRSEVPRVQIPGGGDAVEGPSRPIIRLRHPDDRPDRPEIDLRDTRRPMTAPVLDLSAAPPPGS